MSNNQTQVDKKDATRKDPKSTPTTSEIVQTQINTIISELTEHKTALDSADEVLESRRLEKQEALAEANKRLQDRLAEVRAEEGMKITAIREEKDELLEQARDDANQKREAYAECLDSVTDPKTGLVQLALLSAMGFEKPGRKR